MRYLELPRKPLGVYAFTNFQPANGFTVAQHLRSRDPNARIIFMSGLVQSDYPSARHYKPDGWLNKPILFDDLCQALSKLAA